MKHQLNLSDTLMHDHNHKRFSYPHLRSLFFDPVLSSFNNHQGILCIPPWLGRSVPYRTLRRVAEKAWILNLCIQNIIKKVRPFLKPSTNENQRGFRIVKNNADKLTALTKQEQDIIEYLQSFFLNTGENVSTERGNLDCYVTKLVRDLCTLDQVAVELQHNQEQKLYAFWLIDPATIEVALPESEQETGIKYVQTINTIPYAYYKSDDLLFECMNPRSDIEHAGYGYSLVEQAIDLICSSINTFIYNSGFFTENKLPRGMLLLQGDLDEQEKEMIEDYISNVMSGTPASQWKIPIIPSGTAKTGESSRTIEWVSFQSSNREMEFQAWYDLQLSGITALFGLSLEDVGLHSQKSQPLIGADTSPKLESTKSLVLGDILGFLQQHFNRILSYKSEQYRFEFVGYERDDPKLTLDIDKGETESYKTIDEKRLEKGLKPFNEKWSQIPLNSQVVQVFMSEQGKEQEGMEGGEEELIDESFEDDNESAEDDNESSEELIEKSVNDQKIRIVL